MISIPSFVRLTAMSLKGQVVDAILDCHHAILHAFEICALNSTIFNIENCKQPSVGCVNNIQQFEDHNGHNPCTPL